VWISATMSHILVEGQYVQDKVGIVYLKKPEEFPCVLIAIHHP
jgi:hypothetical protein